MIGVATAIFLAVSSASCASSTLDIDGEEGSDSDSDSDSDGDADADQGDGDDAGDETDDGPGEDTGDSETECACDEVSECCDGCSPIGSGDSCEDGDLCTEGETCDGSGECAGGVAVDCSTMDDQCNTGVCVASTGDCAAEADFEGEDCDDGDSCTADEVCTLGACVDPDGEDTLFFEDFSDSSAGWLLDTQWAIGTAAASTACSTSLGMSQDPGTDHSEASADNGVAGVVLGGCTGTTTHAAYCLTSPAIDTSALPAVWMSYWRWLNSDYSPYMTNTIDAWNGSAWVNVFATGSAGTIDGAWTYFEYDLSAHANAAMQVRWCYAIGSSGVFDSSGWNIDDVSIGPTPCGP
jgi:hypothetical protein